MGLELLNLTLPHKTPFTDRDSIVRTMKESFGMTKQRCYNSNCADYRYYGGRGITICDRWLENFDNFIEDMGLRPEGLTLERLDNDGPYSKENCIWGTRKMQARNRGMTKLLTVDGVTHTLAEWAEITGIGYPTLKARVNVLKYEPKDVIGKPVKCGGLLEGREYKPVLRRKMSEITPRGFSSKLTAFSLFQVREIQNLLSQNTPKTEIARQYNVDVATITAVQLKKGAYRDI
ncbi:MAG: hypothetical protein QX198_08710 [Methylococcaceae bacterium]